MLLNLILHLIPNMLYKIKIWGIRREPDIRDPSSKEIKLSLKRPVRTCPVVHLKVAF
jgi:hypothetical protein